SDLGPCLVVAFSLSGALPADAQPLVEGAVADAEQAAEQTDRVGGLLRLACEEDRGFFRISFSSSSWAT
ncbi:hypothetical protein, partial [Micromonospora aurantiaca (nom. illeg.)]|uniref:hypothetical protein n=1 Tax=Micromonospora aurantiaca (nom. illeg.) TaxID=47850 RepID=UPI003F4A324C